MNYSNVNTEITDKQFTKDGNKMYLYFQIQNYDALLKYAKTYKLNKPTILYLLLLKIELILKYKIGNYPMSHSIPRLYSDMTEIKKEFKNDFNIEEFEKILSEIIAGQCEGYVNYKKDYSDFRYNINKNNEVIFKNVEPTSDFFAMIDALERCVVNI